MSVWSVVKLVSWRSIPLWRVSVHEGVVRVFVFWVAVVATRVMLLVYILGNTCRARKSRICALRQQGVKELSRVMGQAVECIKCTVPQCLPDRRRSIDYRSHTPS